MRNTDTAELVDSLASNLAPVRPIWAPGRRMAVWSLAQLVFAAALVGGSTRPDLAPRLHSSSYLIELALLSCATLLLARSTLAAAIPGAERWRIAGLAFLVGTVAFALSGSAGFDTTQAIDTFARIGVPCAVHTILLSLLPAAWLMVAAYRGAPLHPARAGLVAGAAGFLLGFTLMRLMCPVDEGLHMMVWHAMPVALGTIVSAGAGALALSAWRRRWAGPARRRRPA